ncbi:LexA family protein [Psychrobacillus sp. FSL K6-1415]|uniref:LexA family protein n=1 Tax=Psychrobacillus sp. FSL K6-1415 TaxID=2921544 RepID=UPI0030FC75E8
MNNRQKEIYGYIKKKLSKNKYSPSIREITAAVGLKSVSTVLGHLERVRDIIYIDFVHSSPRTLQIVQ